MDLLPIGSNELIRIKTEKVTLFIKGKQGSPVLGNISYANTESSIAISCKDSYDIGIVGVKELTEAVESGPDCRVYLSAPIFYEYTNYELVAESNTEQLEFWHDNNILRKQITVTGSSGRLLSGLLNFGSELGYSDLVIRIGGKDYLTVRVEVYPSKLDYREDYKKLLEEVTREIYNLAFEFLRKTYMQYQSKRVDKNSPVEFFAILENIFKDFLRSADLIMAKPHHILQTTHPIVAGHKVRRSDNKSLRWLEQHQQYLDDDLNIVKGMTVKKQVTYDTKENRLTKYILQTTLKKLRNFKNLYQELKREKDEALLTRLDDMSKALRWRQNNTFLRNVEAEPAGMGMSLVFSMAPGYRELYKYYLLLLRGLDILDKENQENPFNISVKNLAELYEYWCFIKLNSLLKKDYQLDKQDIIKFHGNRLFVTLVKGEEASRVVYLGKNKKDKIILSYNQGYGKYAAEGKSKSITVSQKPDNVLKLVKEDSGNYSYEYIFDAKYRLDSSEKYVEAYGTPGPPEDTINTMHRYKDAIIAQNEAKNYERTMYGAYVLFPYKDAKGFAQNTFSKENSIKKVNVGAFPFLPSVTEDVKEFLTQLIEESPEDARKRAINSQGTEQRLTEFWIATELYQWITGEVKEEKSFTYNDWQITMSKGLIRFRQGNQEKGIYAKEYLRYEGSLEEALEETGLRKSNYKYPEAEVLLAKEADSDGLLKVAEREER